MRSLVREGKGKRDGGRARRWQHLKLPWESCATESYLHSHWPSLSLSIACVSVTLQASQSGSVTLCCFSSSLLLFSLTHPFLSCSVFHPIFPLLPLVSSSHHLPPPSRLVLSLPTTPVLLICSWRRRIRCELNLPTVRRWLRQPATVRVKELCGKQRWKEVSNEKDMFSWGKWRSEWWSKQSRKDVLCLQMGVWFRPAEANANVCRQTGLRGADRREMVSTCYTAGPPLFFTP